MSEDLFPFTKNKENVIERAEEIYQMFTNEYWQLEPQAAHMTKLSVVMSSTEKGKQKTDSVDTTLMNMFSLWFSSYETSRGGFGSSYSASKLIEIFNIAKMNNVVKKTEGFLGKFKQLIAENSKLKSQIENLTKEKDDTISDLKKERDGFKKRWEDCETNKLKGTTETGIID